MSEARAGAHGSWRAGLPNVRNFGNILESNGVNQVIRKDDSNCLQVRNAKNSSDVILLILFIYLKNVVYLFGECGRDGYGLPGVTGSSAVQVLPF